MNIRSDPRHSAERGDIQSLSTSTFLDDTLASRIFAFIAIAWFVYAVVFIFRSSVVVGGVRYFLLFDDEMISMRYAANLVHGYGLVFNPHGARVEGFTNPLWVLIMAFFHLLPVSLAKMSLFVQLLCAALMVINLVLVWRLADLVSPGSKAVALGAVVLTACYFPLNQWALRGTEVALLTPLLTLAVFLGLRTIDGGSPRWLWPLLGIGTLTRLDMTVPALVIIAMVAWFDRPRRRQHLLHGLGYLALFVGTELTFNLWYYGNALPNTYYLKMSGFPAWLRIYNGIIKESAFLAGVGLMILALTCAIVWLRRDAKVLTLLAVFGGQIAYSVYVGGDAWEDYGGANRFIAIAMPLFMVLLATALETTSVALSRLMASQESNAHRKWREVGLFSVLALASTIFLATSSQAKLREILLLDPPQELGHVDHLKWALTVNQLTDSKATIGVVWAGIIPYFANRRTIDLLGKNDATIAHEPMHLDPKGGFYPGHMKWDYDYSIGTLKPDVVIELFRPTQEDLERELDPSYSFVKVDGEVMFFRVDSHDILWSRVAKLRNEQHAMN